MIPRTLRQNRIRTLRGKNPHYSSHTNAKTGEINENGVIIRTLRRKHWGEQMLYSSHVESKNGVMVHILKRKRRDALHIQMKTA